MADPIQLQASDGAQLRNSVNQTGATSSDKSKHGTGGVGAGAASTTSVSAIATTNSHDFHSYYNLDAGAAVANALRPIGDGSGEWRVGDCAGALSVVQTPRSRRSNRSPPLQCQLSLTHNQPPHKCPRHPRADVTEPHSHRSLNIFYTFKTCLLNFQEFF